MESPKYIEDFTTQELEAELEYRRNRPPELIVHANWLPIVDYVMDVLHHIDAGGSPNEYDDFDHRIRELVLEAMYGKNIWEWWNRKWGSK